jgi:hypothetical protein
MPDVPRRVQARGPVHVGPGLRVYYQPTNTRRDLPRIPASQGRKAMDDFLVSPELQETVLEAAADIEADAVELATSEGLVDSGKYVSSFDHRAGEIVVVNDGEFTNPRVSAEVSNDAAHAAAVEYGNKQVGAGHRILGRIAAKYDNPKGGVS